MTKTNQSDSLHSILRIFCLTFRSTPWLSDTDFIKVFPFLTLWRHEVWHVAFAYVKQSRRWGACHLDTSVMSGSVPHISVHDDWERRHLSLRTRWKNRGGREAGRGEQKLQHLLRSRDSSFFYVKVWGKCDWIHRWNHVRAGHRHATWRSTLS